MSPTRFLMTASSVTLAVLGLLGTFAPDAALRWMGAPVTPALVLTGQVTGALYLGFAALDWMVRDGLIGGIYNRPVVIANLMHFLVAGLAMIRALVESPAGPALWALASAYAGLAAGFGIVMFRHPVREAPQPARPAPHA